MLGVMDGRGVADSGTIDDHKDAISALESSAAAAAGTAATPSTSGHSHSHEGSKSNLLLFSNSPRSSAAGVSCHPFSPPWRLLVG